MKRSILYFSGMLLVAVAAGCSSNVAPPVTYPQVSYVKGGTYVYYAQNLSSTAPYDTVAGSGDTITSVVLMTDTSYQDMSGVTEIQNKHSNPGTGVAAIDTTYIAQSNGNYWHYNYGLQLINGDQAALNTANSGKQIKGGWVLQAKLSDNEGGAWTALDTSITITLGTAAIKDSATEASDSSIAVGSSQDLSKHSVHSISLSAGNGIVKDTLIVNTFVSATDGPVLDIFHPTTLISNPVPGRIILLLKTK
jgi:hypothetical protein